MQGRNLHARKERRGVNYVCSSNEEKEKYKEEQVENVKAKKRVEDRMEQAKAI